MKDKTLVIIPALNEAKTINQVVNEVRMADFYHILVVNDGSVDQTLQKAEDEGVFTLSHEVNQGMGAATKSGIEWGLDKKFSYFLTLDADMQHCAKDLPFVLEALQTYDCVIGSRFLKANDIPFFVRMANKVANLITGVFLGVWSTDSQSGMRGFTREVAETINVSSNGFEFCSEFLKRVQQCRFSRCEVPISVFYPYHARQKGQGFSTGIQTGFRIIKQSFFHD